MKRRKGTYDENLKIKGEISNFKVHSSGNVYLSLKDQNSKINCVIFRNDYDRNLNLENGTKVIASGYISVYERDGSYQLYIKHIEIAGIGNLYIEFNKLKEKLQKEGLFDYKYKKPIPKIPKSLLFELLTTKNATNDPANPMTPSMERSMLPSSST